MVITDGPDRLTVTPERTALVLSVTVPLTAPVVAVTVCAPADPAQGAAIKNSAPAMRPIPANRHVPLTLTYATRSELAATGRADGFASGTRASILVP